MEESQISNNSLELLSSGYIWKNGQALIFSRLADTSPHQHHAMQISVGMDRGFRLRESKAEDWQEYQAIAITPDCLHQFHSDNSLVAFIYLDPESQDTRKLLSMHKSNDRSNDKGKNIIVINQDFIKPHIVELNHCWQKQYNCKDANEVVRNLMQGMLKSQDNFLRLDERICHALSVIETLPDRRISEKKLAEAVTLSPSRFRHLFRENMGLPLRRYLLWRRLQDATIISMRSGSLTEGSHESGFADSAHMSRTFRQMFGINPSKFINNSRFVQFQICSQ